MLISEFLEKSKPVTVFSELNKKDVPWKEKYSNTVMLDNLYQYSHSNKLICASLCDSLDLSTLVEMIYTLNIENWNKLYENYTIAYNPIENYSMTEKGKKTNTGTQGNKQTGNARSESTSNIFAYNVTTSNPASSSVATSNPNLENVRTDNLTEINELTDQEIRSKILDAKSEIGTILGKADGLEVKLGANVLASSSDTNNTKTTGGTIKLTYSDGKYITGTIASGIITWDNNIKE